ncbi:MAG: hypothetical protein IJX77_00195 [Ruminococcus sp.]|nr:hypothetical protein [Ruminococcus sp.]
MKKLLAFLLSAAASASLIASAPAFEYNSFAAQEAAAEETAEDSAEEEEGSSRTAVVLTVIAVFTVTTAVTSVFTYRIRRKSFTADLRSDGKPGEEDPEDIS